MHKFVWVSLILISAFFNALWGCLSKKKLQEIETVSYAFLFRAGVSLFFFFTFIFDRNVPNNSLFWIACIVTGFLHALIVIFMFKGIKEDYYSTYSLVNTTPVFSTIFAIIFLHEALTLFILIGIAIAVFGTLFFSNAKKISLYGLICAVLYGGVAIFNKIGVTLSSPLSFPFFQFIFTCFFLLFPVMKQKKSFKHSFVRIKDILPISFLSFLALFTMFVALKIAPVSLVIPVRRTSLIFGFLLSFFYLKEYEFWKRKLLGGILILIGTLFIIYS